jgi:hypothetical protein
MPRFLSQQDFDFFQHINKELLMDVVDAPIVLYKIIPELANTNIYGEVTTGKPRYKPMQLHALVRYTKTNQKYEGFGFDVTQTEVEFRLQKKLLMDTQVYPDVGDIIKYNDNLYEIHNINEIQLVANNPLRSHSIICFTHLSRKSSSDIEETHT